MALERRRKRTRSRNGSNGTHLRVHVLPEFLLILTRPNEVVLHRIHYLLNDGKGILAFRITEAIRLLLLWMIVTNDDILHPILIRQNDPLPLFDRCLQMALLRGRESPLHGTKIRDTAVATSELILRFLGQVQVEVGVVVAVAASA